MSHKPGDQALLEQLQQALPPAVTLLEAQRLRQLLQQRAPEESLLSLGERLMNSQQQLLDKRGLYLRHAEVLLALRCAVVLLRTAEIPRLIELALDLVHRGASQRLGADALASLLEIALTPHVAFSVQLTKLTQKATVPWRLYREAYRLQALHWPDLAVAETDRICALHNGDQDGGMDQDGAVKRYFSVRHLPQNAAGLKLLQQLAARSDSSEWVRQAIVTAVSTALQEDPTQQHLSNALQRFLEPQRETSPRVRALVGQLVCDALLVQEAAWLQQAVLQALDDPEPMVQRVCLERLRRKCKALASSTQRHIPEVVATDILPRLARSLRSRLATGGFHIGLATAAADAIVALQAVSDPLLADVTPLIAATLTGLREGGVATLVLPQQLSEKTLGQCLALLSQDDLGLYANLQHNQLRLRRGQPQRFALWRLWHELKNPRPDKRRDVSHVLTAAVGEDLRAHSGQLASPTASLRLGEPRINFEEGAWGRHLPWPGDVLDLAHLRPRTIHLFSSRGSTLLRSPRGIWQRLKLFWYINRRFQKMSEAGFSALSAKPGQRGDYIAQLRRLGIEVEFTPYQEQQERFDPGAQTLFVDAAPVEPPGAGDTQILGLAPFALELPDLVNELLSPVGNDVGQLALYAATLGSLLVGYAAYDHYRSQQQRQQIPLTIGGWGTRGKSSVERLKAAMFCGMGYETLCKTTGSTPSLLYAPPWESAVEIPIFRPADRASIWEQRDILAIAAKLGVQVFTWECMAIRPSYARMMQNSWMRDPVCTLTNTYADHEDQQGPGATDVARALCHVVAPGSTVLSAEHAMQPVVQAEVQKRGAEVRSVERHAHQLIAEDLLARFPDLAHRRNIALLRLLAEQLGFDPDVACLEAAGNMVLEIGALRTMGPIQLGDYRVSFANSMAANDAVSTLENLRRVDRRAGVSLVIVANTRRDRPTRTEAFARAMVHDLDAAGRVFTGTDATMAQRIFAKEVKKSAAKLQPVTTQEALELLDKLGHKIGVVDHGASGVVEVVQRALSLENATLPSAHWQTVEQLTGDLLSQTEVTTLPQARRSLAQSELAKGVIQSLVEHHGAQSGLAQHAWEKALLPRLLLRSVRTSTKKKGDSLQLQVQIQRVYRELMMATTTTAAAQSDAVVTAALQLVAPGEVLLFATQNIKGVGRSLLSDFGAAQGFLYGDGSSPVVVSQQGGLMSMAALAQRKEGAVSAQAAAVVQAKLGRTNSMNLWKGAMEQLRAAVEPVGYIFQRWRAGRIMAQFARRTISPKQAQQRLSGLLK